MKRIVEHTWRNVSIGMIGSLIQPTRQCQRCFATSSMLSSGHNKWSKIKHEKGAADHKKTVKRTQFAQALTLYSRLHGPDPNTNSQLAAAIAAAKKASTPKHIIDQAIERGQGRSVSGTALEPLRFEIMMPPSVALILDCETDNKLRTMQELGTAAKKYNARIASTEFFFSRSGQVVFEQKDGTDLDDIFEDAIDAGAEDLEKDDEGNIIVISQPAQTTQIAQAISEKFDLKILSAEIIWIPKEETRTPVDAVGDVKQIAHLLTALKDLPDVQGVYSNAYKGADIPEEEWAALEDNLDG